MDNHPKAKKAVHGVSGLSKGQQAYMNTQGKNYEIKFDTSRTCTANVLKKTPGGGKYSAIRVDKPHRGAEFNHINLDPRFTGKPDPHLRLPKGGLTTATKTAKFCKVANKANKVLLPVAIAADTYEVGTSVYNDYSYGTSRNTVESSASIAGGWGGAYGGTLGGSALGTAICPGVGTVLGAIFGGIGGGIGGSLGAGAAAEAIGDALEYDMVEVKCKSCGRRFKARKYRGEDVDRHCENCRY